MNSKNVVIGVGAVLLVILGVSYLKPAAVNVEVKVPQTETRELPLAAVSTLDGVDTPDVSIGGRKTYQKTIPFTATSSVVCSVKNPFNATSTMASFSAVISRGLLGANTFTLSTSSSAFGSISGTTGYGSSSPAFIKDKTVASTLSDSISFRPYATTTTNSVGYVWDSFPVAGGQNWVIGATDYINLRIATGTPGLGFYGGSCSYNLEKL